MSSSQQAFNRDSSSFGPEINEFLDCFSPESKKYVLWDQHLRASLKHKADGQVRFFGWRYGNFGGFGAAPEKGDSRYPHDVLDLACYLFNREKNPYHLQQAVGTLLSHELIQPSAQPFAAWIVHPMFPTLVKMWEYSYLGYIIVAVFAYSLNGNVWTVLNALLTYRAVIDFLTCSAREATFNVLIHSVLFFMDLFFAFRFESWTRKISLVPVVFRFALLLFAVQYGGPTSDFIIPPPPVAQSTAVKQD